MFKLGTAGCKLGFLGRLSIFFWCFFALSARAGVDIRVSSPLTPSITTPSYTLSVGNCSSAATIQAGAQSQLQLFSVADARRDLQSPDTCLIDFSLSGSGALSPVAHIVMVDGAVKDHSELFTYDDEAPRIEFKSTAIVPGGDKQNLVVTLEASDNTDVQYVGFNVSGLRASDIRAAGGVLAEAKRKAFAKTDHIIRVYPDVDGQQDYVLSLPIDSALSNEAIAQDVIVLIDAFVVDSSGNQATISKVAFTGDSIQEQAKALLLSNNKIVINNILQTPVLRPAVDFQFRGVVDLSGPGNGITYTSSHPDVVGVTAGGVIYALKETTNVEPHITVSYAGLDSIDVPVEVDFSKTLTSIGLKGFAPGQVFELSQLNTFFPLPELEGVFNDGSRTQISSNWTPIISVDNVYSSVLEKNRLGQVKAQSVIPASSPAYITLSLKELSGISSQIAITAKDGLPSIELKLPTTIQPAQELLLKASVKDDVGISEVQFLLDGAPIGTKKSAPYELVMPISEELQGKVLNFSGVVTDTAGQKQISADYSVQVIAALTPVLPSYDFELPVDGQRIVAKSPITMQIATSLGILPEAETSSEISQVEFFFDGAKIGEASFPSYETRKTKTPDGKDAEELFELWRFSANTPSITTNETSMAISARVHGYNKGQSDAPAKLIRIVKNTAPTARILSPLPGTPLTISQETSVVVEATDDTLSLGTRVELYANEKLIGNYVFNGGSAAVNSLVPRTESITFKYTPLPEQLGETIRFRAKVIDYHQDVGYSEYVKTNVKGDEAPTVALSNPTEGASFVSGLSIPIRANAVDDIAVARVDFYVNEQLVGSDKVAPYAYEYETPKGIQKEQILSLHAVAMDSAGKQAESNRVKVTLGFDEEPPVVNLASPVITGSDAGKDIADVIENSEFVFKIAGYDNVRATRLEVKGIKKVGAQFILTGNANDVLHEDQFPLQEIPGALRAYSALALVKAPVFSRSENVPYDPYPVSVVVYDEVGNSSKVEAVVAIRQDAKPEVTDASFNRTSYFARDTLQTTILAKDDKAVERIELKYFVGSDLLVAKVIDNTKGLAPMSRVQISDQVDLSTYNVLNQDQVLSLQVVAYDKLGQASTAFNKTVPIHRDHTAPLAAISSPVQGSVVYTGENLTVQWRAVDESRMAKITIVADGRSVFERSDLNKQEETGSFAYKVPTDVAAVDFIVTAEDIYGNKSASNWNYDVNTDLPPSVSIRHPAAGSRYVEGEAFTINALVADDRQVSSVTFFSRLDNVESVVKTYAGGDVQQVIKNNQYFSAQMRVPNKPTNASIVVGVRAVDNNGGVTEKLLDLTILDDTEAPVVGMAVPSQDLDLYPGESFEVSGTATDDYYVNQLSTVFVSESGQTITVPWEVFGRTDRVEEIRVPNPGSLGSVIAATKLYTDYNARVRIPADFSEYAGNALKFKVKAEDNGVNTSYSPAINVHIKIDNEPPKIQLKSPGATLFDRQKAALEFALVDNVSLSSCRVSIIDSETRVVLSQSNINQPSTNISSQDAIDLSRYVPLAAAGAEFTLLIEAEDKSGNKTNLSQKIRVSPDASPVVSVLSRMPESDPMQGALAFYRLQVNDDFVNASDPASAFVWMTSLGAASGQSRSFNAGSLPTDTSVNVGHMSVSYPEAGSAVGRLSINDKPYLQFADGKALFNTDLSTNIQSLKFEFGGITTSYDLLYRSTNSCDGAYNTVHVDAAQLSTNGSALTLDKWLPVDATNVIVRPIFFGAGASDLSFIKELQIELKSIPANLKYTDGNLSRNVRSAQRVTVYLADRSTSVETTEFIQLSASTTITSSSQSFSEFLSIPAANQGRSYSFYAVAMDRMYKERGMVEVSPLIKGVITQDDTAPTLTITQPSEEVQVTRRARIPVSATVTDNSLGLESLQLRDDQGLVTELGGVFGSTAYNFIYNVPDSYRSGDLNLTLIAKDRAGRSTSANLSLPVVKNENPQLAFKEFASYKVDGQYSKVLKDVSRLNYGEFWVRVGEKFQLTTALTDDAGLQSYTINRINRDGSRTPVYDPESLWVSCPNPLVKNIPAKKTEITFDQSEPTEYEVLLTDNAGQIARRTFLVHPLTNIAPEIRITAPADQQHIVAGTFRIKVGVVASDDRLMGDQSLTLYANGVKLNPSAELTEVPGGQEVIKQAFSEIYDAFEKKYSAEIAAEFGRVDSPYVKQKVYVYSVPSGLIRSNENIVLTAQIQDTDGAMGRDEITFIGDVDEINPEVAVVTPAIGYGPPEFSDFALAIRGYDNVKVAKFEIYSSYGVKKSDGSYQQLPYGGVVRTINAIPDVDADPITTNNIDTPIFTQEIHVDRMAEIASRFAGLQVNENTRFDIWLKVIAYDPSGNKRIKEISYPVRVDQRPVVDVVQPLDGSKQVESTSMYVNVNAYDDVGIDSLRLVAYKGAAQQETQIFSLRLRQPPYNFSVPLPAFDKDNPANNRVRVLVEAIDSYGAAYGDLDKHIANEEISVEIIGDVPPTVTIGKPVSGQRITEGEYLLVQVNAVDDVAVDKVVLNVANLLTGDRSITDTNYPYEFLIEVPYGQAGRDLTLTAAVTEKRFSGSPRTVETLNPVVVGVDKDTIAPEISVSLPLTSGSTVAEMRTLPYDMQVRDNVRVTSVRTQLFVDKNNDNQFDDQEEIAQALLLAAPYTGTLSVGKIASYLPQVAADQLPDSLSMLFRVVARDGAGNLSTVDRPVTLVRNAPPSVQQIQVLDSTGANIGDQVTEVTSGRGIVVNVIANDPEAGVSNVSLSQAVGADANTLTYSQVSVDSASPFQFHIQVPKGHVGEYISFRAKATDVDGNSSLLSSPRTLKIVADKPPTAHIVKPSNDQSVIIDGQDLEVFVEALDDLGRDGIDRVAFLLNDKVVYTAYASETVTNGSSGQDHIYRAVITPPENVDGFAVQAIAYDVMGQSGISQVVHVGRIDDTVAPKMSVLQPLNKEILTTGEPLVAAISVRDIGVEADRKVFMRWIREAQTETGEWVTLSGPKDLQLYRNDTPANRPSVPFSDPDNHYYVYWAEFSDGTILSRSAGRNERVRIISRVVTPNHEVVDESYHEVGMPISERRFFKPVDDVTGKIAAKQVYYGAVAQYKSSDRTGSMVGAWSSIDPSLVEQGLGIDYPISTPHSCPVCTGLFLADISSEQQENGDVFVYSPLVNKASQIFAGSIGELHADANFILASKQGVPPLILLKRECQVAL